MLLSVLLQSAAAAAAISKAGAALAAAILVVGAGAGISKIGSSAMEAVGRQPGAAGDIRTNMILAIAFLEGVAIIGLVVCLLVLFL